MLVQEACGGSRYNLGWTCAGVPRRSWSQWGQMCPGGAGNSHSGTLTLNGQTVIGNHSSQVSGFSWDGITRSQDKGEATCILVGVSFSASALAPRCRWAARASDCCAYQLRCSLPMWPAPLRQISEKAPRAQHLPGAVEMGTVMWVSCTPGHLWTQGLVWAGSSCFLFLDESSHWMELAPVWAA